MIMKIMIKIMNTKIVGALFLSLLSCCCLEAAFFKCEWRLSPYCLGIQQLWMLWDTFFFHSSCMMRTSPRATFPCWRAA